MKKMGRRALMLMSGGVDSSVAAHILKKEGYEVIGVHFKTVDDIVFSMIPEKKKVCCSPSDTIDAMKVAKDVGLEDFKIISIKDEFEEKIIKYFINEYKKGITPNPCILCNRFFKFGKAIELADEYNCDVVVSGHYVLSEYSEKYGKYVIKKGVDNYKDQSYFLSYVKQEYLPRLYFPLAKLKKDEIRKIAEELNLIVAHKPDSQELCFIPDNNYKRYLKDRGIEVGEGKVYDLDGNHIGTHTGYTNYTIGQRTGMTFFKSPNMKLHVYKIDSQNNSIIVAPTKKLYFKGLIAKKSNFFIDFEKIEAVCRIRKKSEEMKSIITKIDEKSFKVEFEEPIFAVTPGQFATFYDEDGIVLGTGIIDSYLED
ncbi:tRNA 2-thiouridine(34) synthase MnmA [Oceanotoga sp. DSM 15011]|jgi:tRNA-specific 2-thiouridylase|uniref:tRNA 2-thiouridine(34) synthase MnmA n=1 Tax=unclassified Oceanotoga TaxID=2618448 RepID=UPI0021F4D143|nr:MULTISPECIES: tRNA 2-thiouridine(34) synthase MnmA [unclassified Oceanotoga]MDN5342388.1 tRNA-uridine 2-sulfurtransferase [Oceanotoga sp.]UYO99964.1 tRNA 2-thiouridine(34) synthase MnmA [Oceanotoga sp. DSM 15011]